MLLIFIYLFISLSIYLSIYSNSCYSCSFEPEIIKIGQSPHKMYSNNILNLQESTPILNANTKSSETYCIHYVYTYILLYI